MKEDTRPAWPLGRHAFVPGENRLLVMSRVTSYAKRDEKGNVLPGPENRCKKEPMKSEFHNTDSAGLLA